MSEQPITAEKMERISAYIAAYRKHTAWADRLHAIHDHDAGVVHEIGLSDVAGLITALTAAQARVASLERQVEAQQMTIGVMTAERIESRAIARAALELAAKIVRDNTITENSLTGKYLRPRISGSIDGLPYADAIDAIEIDAIMARAKETGNVG